LTQKIDCTGKQREKNPCSSELVELRD